MAAGLKALLTSDDAAPAQPASSAKPAPAAPAPKPAVEAAPAAAVTTADEDDEPAKPAEPIADDPKAVKGLAAVDKAAAKFRAEQAAAKADLELQRAQLARQKAEIEGRGVSFEELKSLARKNPLAALEKLGLAGEDDLEVVARAAYANSKTGKADPKNKAYAEQTAEKREYQTKLEQLEQQQADILKELKSRDAQARDNAYVTQYLDAAVKAIPTEPTLIGTLHSKNPTKARAALLALGQEMEAAAAAEDGETDRSRFSTYTPSHADVIAEYEKRRRAELDELGIAYDQVVKARTVAPPPAAPKKTLDPTNTTGTQPVSAAGTRAEKLKAVSAGLKKQFDEADA